AAREPSILKTLADPFALTPGFVGAAQPGGADVVEDKAAGSWAAPFMMAMINTKAVHRSNHLLGDAYGRDFVYDEMMMTGSGAAGEKRARAMARREAIQNALIGFAPTRALIRRFVLPKPGQGPSKAARDSGYYDILFIGETADGKSLRVSVKGDRDPGYGSTSKMIAESGICLARDISHDAVGGGFWTTASAMGDKLINRLQAKAGLTFTLENG
ncbi:MAG: saccharopine dehydrogenase, partial [Xanthobacteraceae bacterium]